MLTKLMVTLLCGLLIALALYLFARWVRAAAKGKCCEGCGRCPQAGFCDVRQKPEG